MSLRIVKKYTWSAGDDTGRVKHCFVLNNKKRFRSWGKLAAYAKMTEDQLRAKISVHGMYSGKVFSTPVKEYIEPVIKAESKVRKVVKQMVVGELETRCGKKIEANTAFEKTIPTPKASRKPYLHEDVRHRVTISRTSLDMDVASILRTLNVFNERCDKYNTRTAIFLSAHDRVGGWWGTV